MRLCWSDSSRNVTNLSSEKRWTSETIHPSQCNAIRHNAQSIGRQIKRRQVAQGRQFVRQHGQHVIAQVQPSDKAKLIDKRNRKPYSELGSIHGLKIGHPLRFNPAPFIASSVQRCLLLFFSSITPATKSTIVARNHTYSRLAVPHQTVEIHETLMNNKEPMPLVVHHQKDLLGFGILVFGFFCGCVCLRL